MIIFHKMSVNRRPAVHSDCSENGIWAFDCEYGEPVLIIIPVLAMLGDNPMQSEMACHTGLWRSISVGHVMRKVQMLRRMASESPIQLGIPQARKVAPGVRVSMGRGVNRTTAWQVRNQKRNGVYVLSNDAADAAKGEGIYEGECVFRWTSTAL